MEKQIYFQVRHDFNRKETESAMKQRVLSELFAKKNITVKRLAPCGFLGLLLSGLVVNSGLLPGVSPLILFLAAAVLVYAALGLAAYALIMAGTGKTLDQMEKEDYEGEKDLCQEYLSDRLVLSGPRQETIPYGSLKDVREEKDRFVLVMKNTREIQVKKADFTKGMPEQFADFMRRAMERAERRNGEGNGDPATAARYQVKTVYTELLCINRTAMERRYKKRKWSKAEKYGIPVFTVILLTALVLFGAGISQESLQMLLNVLPVAVVLEIVVLYFTYLHNVKQEEKALIKAGKKSWREIENSNGKKTSEFSILFEEDGFQVDDGNSSLRLDYGSVRGLYETRDCLFLDDLRILGKETLDKKAIEGGREEELKDFLEEKCGKVFQKLDLPAKV